MANFLGMGNWNNAGAGISKNSAPKGSMKLFFEILGVRIWNLFVLNLIYVLACIPVITIGPATAGMTKVLKNYSIDKNSFVWMDFKETFKQNFFKSMIIGIVDAFAYLGVICGIYMYTSLISKAHEMEASASVYYILLAVTLSAGVTFTIMNYYIYLMMVSTDLSMKNIIKNALYLSYLAPKQNILALFFNILLPVAVFLLVTCVNFQFVIIVPFFPASVVGFIICYCCYPVVQKYVINPYYEEKGEQNPESPAAAVSSDPEEVLFEDMGGKEKPVEIKKKKSGGKIIS